MNIHCRSYFLLAVASLLSATISFAQQRKIKTLEVSDTVRHAYVDRPGDLYVFTYTGHLQRFDKDGRLLNLYRKGPSLTSFDPRDGARLFAFYRKDSHYDLMNTSFDVVSSYKIDSAFATEPWLVCTSGDHFIWTLDAADFSLKKIDMRNGLVPVEVSLAYQGKKSDLIALREYQNFVFLLDRKEGIKIYNGVGSLIRTIPQGGLSYFNFIGEELYYLKGDTVQFFDLFTAETRELKLPATKVDIALVTDERLFIVKGKVIDIYDHKP